MMGGFLAISATGQSRPRASMARRQGWGADATVKLNFMGRLTET